MLFNTLEFALFFPLVLALYHVTNRSWKWLVLLVASYYFYMSWNWKYAFILVFSTFVDYAAALYIEQSESHKKRTAGLAVSLFANLGTLFLFKYFNFFSESMNALLLWSDMPFRIPFHELLLPVGISFYTFQTMSYTIDVYRRDISAERHFGIFALYVTFFPQLVAGPIERSSRLLPQLKNLPVATVNDVRIGLGFILVGLFKKSVIADQLAPYVNEIFAHPDQYASASMLLGIVFFAFQIYGDFSGYSDMAIGTARIMGINLMMNFNAPYFAASVGEFWQRWHISLSTWFRDYVYIPLGGNRVSGLLNARNILVTFLVSGLWHGANWTFLAWGALHGTALLMSRIAGMTGIFASQKAQKAGKFVGVRIARVLTTFLFVCIGWTFFRAENLEQALFILNRVSFGWTGSPSLALGVFPRVELLTAFVSLGLLLLHDAVKHTDALRRKWDAAPVTLRFAVIQASLLYILVFGVFSKQEFIYFQF